MRILLFFCFLFTLPLLAAIGHDVYYAYQHPRGLNWQQSFQFSDLGWLWLHYARDSYHMAREIIEPPVWKKYIGPVLEQKSILVAAVPAVGCYLLFFAFRFFVPFLSRLRYRAPQRRVQAAPRNKAELRKRAQTLDDAPKPRPVKYTRK